MSRTEACLVEDRSPEDRRHAQPSEAAVVERRGLPRRLFLVAGGGAAAAAMLGVSCSDDDRGAAEPVTSSSTSAPERARRFFTPREAVTVEAATARILPGTPDDPGAREAEVVVYIDALLASGGWASEPIYRMPPFVVPDEDEGSASEEDEELDTTSYGVTRRPIGTRDRWGEQSMLTPAEVYRSALPALDAYATQRFGAAFAQLGDDQQDLVLADLEAGVPTNFPPEPSSRDFFALLRQHTIEGMFSDPIYGGNRELVGWKLIGWPAAQRAYSVTELQTPNPPRSPQGIADLARYHAGHSDRDEPVFPLAGTDHRQHGGGR
jgi:gluconate 2-dehydrogenase gamma chain